MRLPYSADGSTFDETCRYKDGYFRIGPKGKHIKINSLLLGLMILDMMTVPRWRRPSPTSGVQSVVKAVKWA
jgi:hypothetical protein